MPRNMSGGYQPEVTLIQDVEYGTFFIDAYFEAGFHVEGNVADEDTEPDRDQQHRLEFLGYSQVNENQTYQEHDDVACRCVGKARIAPEIGQVVSYKSDKFSHIIR